MEQVAKCKSLEAIFRDDKKMLDGPHAVGFDIEKDKACPYVWRSPYFTSF